MTQINSYNGGATLPGDAVAIDKIKSLTLQHNPTGEGQATEVVYNPLEGKTVPVRNLVVKDKFGNTVGIYDPLANSNKELQISEDSMVFLWDGSPTIPKVDRTNLMHAVQSQTPAFIAYAEAAGLSYYVFSQMVGGRMVFTGVTEDEVRVISISPAPNPDESYNITYESIPLSPVVDQYIKKEALYFPDDTPWLSSWASTMGMNFGTIIGAVCDKGNNKHYYGTIAASVDSSAAIPCGCILFLDETVHPLESDECRNISINFTIFLEGPARDTEADAISAVPASVWLRVFRVWKKSSDSTWHAPLSPSQGIANGIFVNLDSIYLARYANLNSVDNKYYANAMTKITVSVIGGHWSYTYEG